MTARPDSPTSLDVTQAWIERYLENVHTALPGRIESYNVATQRANVLPLVRTPVRQPDGSAEYSGDTDLPVIAEVPILFPRTGSWFLSLPIAVGDTGLLVFPEQATGHWEAGDGSIAYPGDLRRHHIASAVFIPGFYVRSRALENVSADDMVLGNDAGTRVAITASGQVTVTQGETVVLRIAADGTVHLGASTAADFVALAALVKGNFDALKAIFTAWAPVPGDGGAALKTALAGWTVAEVKASKVKAT